MLILKIYFLCIWNSKLAGYPLFFFTKSGRRIFNSVTHPSLQFRQEFYLEWIKGDTLFEMLSIMSGTVCWHLVLKKYLVSLWVYRIIKATIYCNKVPFLVLIRAAISCVSYYIHGIVLSPSHVLLHLFLPMIPWKRYDIFSPLQMRCREFGSLPWVTSFNSGGDPIRSS